MRSPSSPSTSIRALRAAAIACCVAVSTGTFAADDAAPTPPKETVTGSNIARPAVEPSSPIITVDRDYIERSGATTAPEVLNSLPVMQNRGRTVIVGSGAFRARR